MDPSSLFYESRESANAADRRTGLPEIELNAIELFIRLARVFGISKSIGEIYGLLFVSPHPVPFDYVREKLKISNGSASQGLRLLRSVGAIKEAYVPGDRRDHYVVETGLATIATGFLREKIAPNLFNQEEKLARLCDLLEAMPPAERPLLESRMQTLRNWHRQARDILPMVMEGLREQEPAL